MFRVRSTDAGTSPLNDISVLPWAMIVLMRNSSRSRRLFVMCALPLALWAALPAVRWCPPGWRQACAAALIRCSTMQVPAACDHPVAGCPLAATARSTAPHASCPTGSPCPVAPAAPPSTPSRRDPFPAGGAFCVGDPNGGAALRAHGPRLEPATSLLAIVPDPGTSPRVLTLAVPIPQLASRPPPRAWLRRPPARAPPSIRQT